MYTALKPSIKSFHAAQRRGLSTTVLENNNYLTSISEGINKPISPTTENGSVNGFNNNDYSEIKLPAVAKQQVASQPRPIVQCKQQKQQRTEPFSEEHINNVKMLSYSWNRAADSQVCVVTDAKLEGFKPFDLEEWWGRRMLQNCQLSQS